MKKLVFLALLLGFTIQGFAQKGTFGVRAGYNISNLDFEGTAPAGNKHRNSFYIGFFGEYALSGKVALVPELQFSAEGAGTETLHLDFIQAPIFFKFRLNERWRLGIGPQVSLKVHKEKDAMKNLHYSGVAGVEYRLNEMLFFDVRYINGFTNIFDEVQPVEARHSNIQLGVGYQF